ncbi:MAG: nucleotidyltransferase family protein [Ilumatobacteraceae bacterium]
MVRVAALLAAGGASRFKGSTHKLLAPLAGRTVWEHSLAAVVSAGFDHVVVVTGAVTLPVPDDVSPTVIWRSHPAWAAGQAGSVQVAVRTAAELGAEQVTIGLADQPFVPSEAWRTVADAPTECRIVIATYDGVPGPNPVRLDRSVWPLLPTEGDAGARHLITEHASWVCRVACLGSGADIDTLEDLERWNN